MPKEGPGPATYNYSGRINSSRGFSIGIRHSPYVMPLITGHDMDYWMSQQLHCDKTDILKQFIETYNTCDII